MSCCGIKVGLSDMGRTIKIDYCRNDPLNVRSVFHFRTLAHLGEAHQLTQFWLQINNNIWIKAILWVFLGWLLFWYGHYGMTVHLHIPDNMTLIPSWIRRGSVGSISKPSRSEVLCYLEWWSRILHGVKNTPMFISLNETMPIWVKLRCHTN